MLKVFRDNLKYLSWVLWVVIAVFVLFVFVDFGGVAGRMSGGGGTFAATVGDQVVSYDDYRREYQNLEAFFRQRFGEGFTQEVAQQFGLPQRALEQAVQRVVLLGEARRLGLAVGDAELREAIRDVPWLQDEEGRFVGGQEYHQRLQRSRVNPEVFERGLREQLLLDKLNRILAEGVFVSAGEVEEAYRDQVERAAIRYVQQPAADLGGEVELAAADLAAYLEAHREDFRLPEQRKIAYLLVDNSRLRDQVEVTDEEVRAYYDQHPDEFTQEEQVQARHILLRTGEDRSLELAKDELEQIRRRIEGGESFAKVATEVSDDPGSAARGGSLGYFGRGRMTPEFEQAAFDAPVGELVGPVETPFGVHLIEVTDHRQAGLQPFEEVAPRIRARKLGEGVAALAEQRAHELSTRLHEGDDPADLEVLRRVAAGEEAVIFQQVGPLGRDDLVPGIGRSPEFEGAAFGLEPGKLSEPVKVPRGWVLVTVEEVLPPRAPALEEVEAKVRAAAAEERRQQLAMERLGNAAADVAEGRATFDEAVAALGLEPQESGEFGRGGTIPGLGYHPAIVEAAMGLSEGEVGGPYGTTQGAVLFEVTSRSKWDPEEFEQAKEATRLRLEDERLGRLLGALIEQRKLELGVNYNARLAEDLGLTEAPETS